MKFIILSSLLAVVIAQRPGYLGSGPVGYPGLASRFKDESTTTSQNPLVNNRLGEPDGTTPKLPVDARGDSELVNRLNTWPRENRPFWILNADQIEAHRNADRNTVNNLPNRQQFQGNGQTFQGNNRPVQGNGQFFQGNGQPFPNNGQSFQGNGQPFQGNGQGFQGNGQGFPGNGQGFQGVGQGFQGNGQPIQGNGQFYPENNQQFQSRLGVPEYYNNDFVNQVPSIPIRPAQTRGSFAGSL